MIEVKPQAPAKDYPRLPGRQPRRLSSTPRVNAMVANNIALAHLAARRAWGSKEYRRGLVYEDVLSAAMYGLWRAAAAFQPRRGLKFCTLAYKCCWWAATAAIKNQRRRKCVLRPVALPADVELARTAATIPGAAELVLEDEERARWIEWLRGELAALPERHATIVAMRVIERRTLTDIGAEVGLTKERIRQIVFNTMEHLTRRYRREKFARERFVPGRLAA